MLRRGLREKRIIEIMSGPWGMYAAPTWPSGRFIEGRRLQLQPELCHSIPSNCCSALNFEDVLAAKEVQASSLQECQAQQSQLYI